MYDLPSEDPEEPGLPDEFHDLQPDLLSWTCRSPLHPEEDCFIAKDLNLYYDVEHTQWYKRPDWFLVLGVPRSKSQQELRWSYVIWQENVSPFLVVELLSPGTEGEDLGRTTRAANSPPTKWKVYEQLLKIPYYVVYDRDRNQFLGFKLERSGEFYRYRELDLSEGRLWLEELGLGLGIWQGSYKQVNGLWLRFYDADGNWIPTPVEIAERERQEKERARQQAEQAQQQADREQQEKERAQQQAEQAQQQVERERLEKEQAQLQAERERQRAEQLEQLLSEHGINLPEQI